MKISRDSFQTLSMTRPYRWSGTAIIHSSFLPDWLNGSMRVRERRSRDVKSARVILQTIGQALLDFLAEVRASTDEPNLCVAGGLFHNAYLNALVAQSPHFERTFVPVSCGNGGLAAGAALLGMAQRQAVPAAASSPFLGPGYGNGDINVVLENCKLTYTALDDERLIDAVVSALQSGRLVAWFRDRMEWGPRALGNRSIFADPLSE